MDNISDPFNRMELLIKDYASYFNIFGPVEVSCFRRNWTNPHR